MNEWHPSLIHVEEFNSHHEYQKITIEEAVEKYHRTVSAKDETFRCYLCGDFVTLTNGPKMTRCFKHERNHKHFCQDESKVNNVAFEQEYQKIRDDSRSLPLYLKTDRKELWFEIGFFRLSDQSFQVCQNTKVLIFTDGKGRLLRTYQITPDNFGATPITHIQIGLECSNKYILEYSGSDGMKGQPYWGNEVHGIDPTGTVFDGKSGRRIPDNTSVESGHKFWLFTNEPIFEHVSVKVIEETRLKIPAGWHLYQIIANTATQDAANFFRHYHLFLTGIPEKFILLWPPCTQNFDEHIILHDRNELSLLRHGERTERLELYLGMSKSDLEDAPGDQSSKTQFIDLPNCGENFMPLIWTYRNRIYQYAYLLEDPLLEKAKKPKIRITDQNGCELMENCYFDLPPDGWISALAPFNGFAEIQESGLNLNRIEIKGETETEHLQVHYGWTIRFYQGLDCIREISFQRKPSSTLPSNMSLQDLELLKKLRQCRGEATYLPHSAGCIALKMKSFPGTKKWLYSAIRKQIIQKDALAILKNVFWE